MHIDCANTLPYRWKRRNSCGPGTVRQLSSLTRSVRHPTVNPPFIWRSHSLVDRYPPFPHLRRSDTLIGMTHGGVELDARFKSALRSVAGGRPQGYTCPLCTETFQAGPKLWGHAKQAHQDSADVAGTGDEEEAKRRFCERA